MLHAIGRLATCFNERVRHYFVVQAGASNVSQAREAEFQSEVEEVNERLFELRVEVQNLAEDTTISVASIKRMVCDLQSITAQSSTIQDSTVQNDRVGNCRICLMCTLVT